jgi:hypothetical protein
VQRNPLILHDNICLSLMNSRLEIAGHLVVTRGRMAYRLMSPFSLTLVCFPLLINFGMFSITDGLGLLPCSKPGE